MCASGLKSHCSDNFDRYSLGCKSGGQIPTFRMIFLTWSNIKFWICLSSSIPSPSQACGFAKRLCRGDKNLISGCLARSSSITLLYGQVGKESQQRPPWAVPWHQWSKETLGHVWHLLSAIGKSMRIQYLTNAYCYPPSKNFLKKAWK